MRSEGIACAWQVTVELTTPEGYTYRVGRLSSEERAQKILRSALTGAFSGHLKRVVRQASPRSLSSWPADSHSPLCLHRVSLLLCCQVPAEAA